MVVEFSEPVTQWSSIPGVGKVLEEMEGKAEALGCRERALGQLGPCGGSGCAHIRM